MQYICLYRTLPKKTLFLPWTPALTHWSSSPSKTTSWTHEQAYLSVGAHPALFSSFSLSLSLSLISTHLLCPLFQRVVPLNDLPSRTRGIRCASYIPSASPYPQPHLIPSFIVPKACLHPLPRSKATTYLSQNDSSHNFHSSSPPQHPASRSPNPGCSDRSAPCCPSRRGRWCRHSALGLGCRVRRPWGAIWWRRCCL